MKIDKTKYYTLDEIVRDGLLIKRDGKPYTSLNMVRQIFKEMGYKLEMIEHKGQLGYRILGTDIEKLNAT